MADIAVPKELRTGGEVFVSRIRVVVGLYMLALAALGGDGFRYYPRAVWVLLPLTVAYTWLMLAVVARIAPRGTVPNWLAWVMTALDSGFILGLSALTGGVRSPFLPILLMVVIAVAIRFNLRWALVASAGTAIGLAGVVLGMPKPDLSLAERVRESLWWACHLVVGAVMAGVLSDLAHRRRAGAEAEARAEHHRLSEERRLRRRLEAIDQARKNFLQALSHDFRTPIASLEALARALDRPDGISAEERSTMLELVSSHARQLGSMLKEVQEVATAESLGAELRLEEADVYMPELIRAAGAAAGVAGDRLVMAIDPGLNVLRTDSDKMLRILTNLLDNAYKHSPDGAPLEVRLRRCDGLVELSVLDRGPGIPPELAARAFEKFVAFGPHRSSGLGMWIVSQFVAGLGGTVGVEPRSGGGLIVRARFPTERLTPAGAWRERSAAS